MKRIVFATNNQHKLQEIRDILGSDYEVVSLKEIGCDVDIPETGNTLEENALQKAQYVYDHYHVSCFADDTGLEVEALDGAPGVHSARYAEGTDHDSEANMAKLLRELDGKEKCNIELQLIDKNNIIERMLYYWSKMYTRQIKAGDNYNKLEKTIVILIADFNIKGLEAVEYHSTWKIIETNSVKKLILTDKFELDIIELSKIKGRENEKDQLLDWLVFLENPESERVTRKMEENENLKEAVEKLDRISEDEKMQRIIELREKAIRDEHAIYDKGLDDGIEEGKAKGAREKQIEIAKSMLKENMDIEIIIKITGLTKQEIEKLQEM